MKNIKLGKLSHGAITSLKNSFYPKVAFNKDNLEDYYILLSSLDISEVPNNTYVLVEPLDSNWGQDYDILHIDDDSGSYVFDYTALVTTTTTTTTISPPISYLPFRTLSGSRMDYSFKYDYPVNMSGGTASYSVVPFIDYTREAFDAWYGSAIPAVDGGFYFIGGRTFKTGSGDGTVQGWDAATVLGYEPNAKFGVVDETGITILGTSRDPNSNEFMINKFGPDGSIVVSGAFIIPTSDIPAPYTGYSYNGNGDLILKPNGEYYSPDCFKFTYTDYIPQGENPPIPVTRYSEPMTANFKVMENAIVYTGYVTNIPENASIVGGGMSSVLNWKPIPGTEEMYYSYYDAIARIDANTNQVIWWIEDSYGEDEVFYILPNKDLVKPTYDSDTGEFIIAQFSYVDGSIVRTKTLTIGDTPLAEDYTGFEWSLSTLNFNGYDGLLYLLADCTAVGSNPKVKKTALFKLDQTTFEVLSIVEIMGDGVALQLLTPSYDATPSEVAGIPSYYGYNCVTGEGDWWMWYEKKVISPTSGYPTKVIAGLLRYSHVIDAVDYYNLLNESDPTFISQYEGFSFINETLYYPTRTGVYTLTNSILS